MRQAGADDDELVRLVARMVSEWETSDELAGEFAERLLALLKVSLSKGCPDVVGSRAQ